MWLLGKAQGMRLDGPRSASFQTSESCNQFVRRNREKLEAVVQLNPQPQTSNPKLGESWKQWCN
jgi:hypothetical protein